MSTTLRDVLENLNSDKIKDRSEGLVSIRQVFQQDRVVETFALSSGKSKPNPKIWLPVFQSIFSMVLKEKQAASKASGSAAALRRLSEAASTLRWLIERSVHVMNASVAEACIEHLTQVLIRGEKVFKEVALDYSKALRCIVGFPAHLDHLKKDTWLKIASLSFNVILNDPLDRLLVDDEELEVVMADDSDMFVEDSDDEGEDELPSTSTKGKKRSRRDATPLPILSPRKLAKQRRNVVVSVSLEQVEFTSLLRILLSTSTAPLLTPNQDDAQSDEEDEPESRLTSGILERLQRFLELYPADSSLLRDYIAMLSAVLDHISLNKISEVEKFAGTTWDALIGLWDTKDKAMKEGLLIVLKHLFPFVTRPSIDEKKLSSFDPVAGIGRLWSLLDEEAGNRRGVDGLSLDSLRLEVASTDSRGHAKPFVAKTFRAGWNFDAEQALSWAILELQADCAATLFQLSESMQTSRPEKKRARLENPILSLLQSIQGKSTLLVRSYHLQVLLFFVDRHWTIVHESLKLDIMSVLLQFVAFDDTSIQSWVFLNLAAISYAESPKNGSRPKDDSFALNSATWDTIWTHTVRRVNVPGICRAACHTGYTLLLPSQSQTKLSQSLIANHRVLMEIEVLLKDMDVQGPSGPFDSVCRFLSQCLTLSSQDARLYRMHLEDKVLSWFIDNWKIIGNRTKMAPHTIVDILHLLETLCGLPKRSVISTNILLPHTDVVDHLIEEEKVKIIRDFVLYSRLPPFTRQPLSQKQHNVDNSNGSQDGQVQLIPPRGRERKISAFFLRTLESLMLEWDMLKEHNPTAEMARRSLDFCVTAIIFESVLAFNGTSTNRQVLQNAGKVISTIAPLLLGSRWVLTEKVLVAQAFEQLALGAEGSDDDTFSEAIARPGEFSGIKEQLLQGLVLEDMAEGRKKGEHLSFLRQVWQNADVQEIVGPVVESLRTLLQQLLSDSSVNQEHAMDVDEKDDFAPIRTAARQQTSSDTADPRVSPPVRHLIQVCISFLASSPFLLSPSGNPGRDHALTEIIIKSADSPHKFCLACPTFFRFVKNDTLHLSLKNQQRFLGELGHMLGQYSFSKNPSFIHIVLEFVGSTLGVWKADDELARDIHSDLLDLYAWLALLLKNRSCGSWSLRDGIARFLGDFLSEDPTQDAWATVDNFRDSDELVACLPTSLLPRLSSDQDIRVRFRATVINAGLFSISHHFNQEPTALYNSMKRFYPLDLDRYEHMLTRLLALGNVLVVSSAVRRGAYWHMLETCIHHSVFSYSSHIEAILVGVSERLGMTSLSTLFEAYASQLAFSLRQLKKDYLSFPPHLLGYRDRKQCAEATFRSFTPFNILTQGESLFEAHCKILLKERADGFHQCFGDVAGLILVSLVEAWVQDRSEPPPDDLEEMLKEQLTFIPGFVPPFEDTLDNIATTVVKCLGDQDFRDAGSNSIGSALQLFDPKMFSVFQALTRYRTFDPLRVHPPNLPAYPTKHILQSLHWLSTRWGGFSGDTTYHVLHGLLNELHSTPLVNEQMRLINAMSLWIAYRQEDFSEPHIADTLIHGATFLLSQSDLAHASRSILEFAFARYPSPKNWKESRLPNMIVRARCIAQDYCSDLNPSVATLGQDLVKWMDAQMISFARKSAYRRLVLRILPTWPQQPSSALAKLYDEISTYDLASILEDHRITSNKFRLVRRLQERTLVDHDDDDNDQFSKVHFWRLKECIPSLERLQEEDVNAFTALLSLHHGHIGSLNVEQPNMLSPRPRHRRNMKKRAADDSLGARDAISLGLLVMLDDDDPSRVSTAYHTLRLALAAAEAQDPLLVPPPEYRKDIECLKVYKHPTNVRLLVDVHEALASETYTGCSADFAQWMSRVSILMADFLSGSDPFFGQLASVLESDIEFSEQVFAILVHTVLQTELKSKQSARPLKESLSKYFTKILQLPATDIRCIGTIVEVVLHLRYFTPSKSDTLTYNKWLEVDFTLLARSAILCGSYTTALLFVELAADQSSPAGQDNDTIEQVLYEIYAHIDEPDGFYGIKTQDLQKFLVKRFHHEKQWEKALRFHGAALEADSSHSAEQVGLLQSFHSFGFDHLAIDTLRYLREGSGTLQTSSMNYKLGWRTETWDLPEQPTNATSAALYRSLRAVYRERDPQTLDATIRSALFEEMEHLQSLGSENLAEMRSVSQDLMCLGEVLQWRQDHAQRLLQPENIDLDSWKSFIDIDARFDFTDLESIMATRISLVRSIRQREERQQIGSFMTSSVQALLDIEKNCLLRLSQAARSSGQVQIALNSVIRAQKMDQQMSSEVREEFANVLWLQKEEKPAVQFLQSIVNAVDLNIETRDAPRYALLFSRLGTWTSEACLEKPADIWEHYFARSISLLDAIPESQPNASATRATVYRECAMFAERQYHAVLTSPDALRWKLYVDRKRYEIETRSKEITRTQSDSLRSRLQHDQARAQKILKEDSELFRKHNNLRESLLKQAIEMHSRCLETSSDFDDDSTIRLCSLWFANFDDESILDTVSDALERIPSRKLVFLAHQITARVSNPLDAPPPRNQVILQRLVVRMCQEHPFHSLYQVYCISDRQPLENRRQSGRFSQSTQTERGSAATNILDRLRSDETNGTRVMDIERLCDASLEWAKFPIVKNPTYKKRTKGPSDFDVPPHLKILSIKAATMKVPVLTARTPLDATLKYENCVWIDHYERKFNTAGGVNLPKVSICHGSDGQKYKQLFKGEGNDDLRQDAVMEQVFDLVNNLLQHDRETKRRDLRVRDYKVIPLSNQAGLLEFVGNTSPLRDWLSRAHPQFHPTDMKTDEIQSKMRTVQADFKDRHDKQVDFFLEVRKKFRPVMRHYFTERHKTPITWFQMRLNYTRSVATNSIVGHVLGLGDRHVSNILLDNVTGEVVHIDLGIAFDQGKLLPVPERVPFRMTADIVDGMGTSGTAGVFQRCAEETLRVLRDESGVIMTVLEVFKHDPLHSWTASEVKVKQAQSDIPTTPTVSIVADTTTSRFNPGLGLGLGLDMTSGSADEAADRALSSVSRKLDKALSIESTVNELIAEATDPMNLATIFYGWSPYM